MVANRGLLQAQAFAQRHHVLRPTCKLRQDAEARGVGCPPNTRALVPEGYPRHALSTLACQSANSDLSLAIQGCASKVR